ncbi:hypothetical protein [Thermoplasma sp. Kam2015]|uniref:hypothetical protein n=1 Tax=Thermoplasma sp. Kam2015 TaxID=2094122 RepID=UPI001F3702E8|nr:hypothetical protein [Thermoplasma sp. Kam2015]
MDNLDAYLDYVSGIWSKINQKFHDQDVNVRLAILQLVARPYYYWIQENQVEEKQVPEETVPRKQDAIKDITSKYGDALQVDNDTVRIVKRLNTDEFNKLKEDLRQLGFLYDAQLRGFRKKQ